MTSAPYAVFVCSCDKYSDVWGPMFGMMEKMWGDRNVPLYLMTNHAEYSEHGVVSLKTGEDISWTDGFLDALDKVPEKYVLVVMEDYFLTKKVEASVLERLVIKMQAEQIGCVRVFACPGAEKTAFEVDGFQFGFVRPWSPYRISLQAALWDKNMLKKIGKRGESAWEFELKGSNRSNRLKEKIVSLTQGAVAPFEYYCTAVVKGYWLQPALDLCQEQGVPVDTSKRPVARTMDEIPKTGENPSLLAKIKLLVKRIFQLFSSNGAK